MDCYICRTMPYILSPLKGTVCTSCYEGAMDITTLINKAENQQDGLQKTNSSLPVSPYSSCKTMMELSRWIKGMANKQMEEANFLGETVSAFREQIHSDILLNPGNDGPSIPAHKAILAMRSEIFKDMLQSDGCIAAPSDSITIAELNHEELECLLEFLYSGRVTKERLEKHVFAMLHAAHKYEIPYLQKYCETHMLDSLNPSNALDVLEAYDACSSNQELKNTALNFVIKNMDCIIFSSNFDAFALKNPNLSVQITRAALKTKRGY